MRNAVFAAVLLLVVSGGVGAETKTPAEWAATSGYVHASFPKGGKDALAVTPVDGGREMFISALAPALPLANAQAIGAWMSPGRYRISGWGNLKWKDGPTFEVQKGRVTDLGDFVGVNVGGYQLVLVPITHAEHQGAVEAATGPFASVLVDPTPLRLNLATTSPPMQVGMQHSGLGLLVDLITEYGRRLNKPSTVEALIAAKDPAEFIRLIRTTTPPVQDEPAVLANGTMYFPADFGQLRKRTPEGEWSNVGMDTLRRIFSVEAQDDRLVAGSDDGRIRESRDGGVTWTEIASLGGTRIVLDIDHENDVWVVTTVEDGIVVPPAKGKKASDPVAVIRLRVNVARRDDLADLALSREFVLVPSEVLGWLGARGQLADGRYYITAGNTPQRLDLATGEWKDISPRERISGLRVSPSTGVLSAIWANGLYSKVYVSSDHGDHWSQIGRPPYAIQDLQMDTGTSGWSSRWNANALNGIWETYAFSPAKNDWEKTGEAPFNCKPTRVNEAAPVLCFGNDASIFSLRNGVWRVEFSAE